MRVVLLKDFVKKNFPVTNVLNYAIEIEKITTSKVQENKFPVFRDYICLKVTPPKITHPHCFTGVSFYLPLNSFATMLHSQLHS